LAFKPKKEEKEIIKIGIASHLYCFFDYAKIVINITQATSVEKKEAKRLLFFQSNREMRVLPFFL
jgi:hypothetical protein